MAHPYWFGVKWEFVCNLCCLTTIEKQIINSTTDDIGKLQTSINRQSLVCPNCEVPIARETEVDVRIIPGSKEYLASLGYRPSPLRRDKHTDTIQGK
jgi:hypothetical protein